MGNRAVIAFTDRNTPKPDSAIYMHWNGGPESVWAIIDVMREGRGMCHSASYSTARFVHLACELVGADDGLSVGVMGYTNATNLAQLGEDAGYYEYDISTNVMKRWTEVKDGARRVKCHSAAAVAAEEIQARLHKYETQMGLRAKLRQALVVEKEKEAA